MGYGTRNNGKTFWPDDTNTIKYISGSMSCAYLQEKIKEWWPESHPDDIQVTSEYIHTDCLGYDLYDPSDFTNFTVIEYTKR